MRATKCNLGARPAGGFTLLEILSVVVILAVAAAIVVPKFGNTGDIQGTAAARQLCGDLMYAQSVAINTQTPVRVSFNRTTSQYTLTAVPVTGSSYVLTNPSSGQLYPAGFTGAAGRLGIVTVNDTTFTSDLFTFDALGSPSAAGDIHLLSQGLTVTVSVALTTGKLSIH
jgi:prepilin-type N-terminal cleavage/methylation domain-containing protein